MQVVVEGREALVACCWYLHRLQPGGDALVHVLNARDARQRKVALLARAPAGAAPQRDIQYSVEEAPGALATDGRPEVFRRLVLRGPSARALQEFVGEALDAYRAFATSCPTGDDDGDDGGEGVASWSWDEEDGMWCRGPDRRRRPLGTLFLPDAAAALVDDFRGFCSPASLRHYARLHVSPTRVYMLHGMPGSGKSSLVHCIASEMGYGVAQMTFGPGLADADVRAALAGLPPRCLLCIEDIDCLFAEGRKMAPGAAGGVTFAGLLAALDACAGPEGGGVGVFLTTNRLCALDAALRRRVDYVLPFGAATGAQARRMFEEFFPGADGFDRFWARVRHLDFSMSTLQKHLLRSLRDGDPMRRLEDFEALASCASSRDDVGTLYS